MRFFDPTGLISLADIGLSSVTTGLSSKELNEIHIDKPRSSAPKPPTPPSTSANPADFRRLEEELSKSVSATITGAWKGQKKWEKKDWDDFVDYVRQRLPKDTGEYYCSGLARELMIDFAKERGLRVKLEYEKNLLFFKKKVVLDSASDKWKSFEQFKEAARNVGAERIAKYNSRSINFEDARAGDMLIYMHYESDERRRINWWHLLSLPTLFDRRFLRLFDREGE